MRSQSLFPPTAALPAYTPFLPMCTRFIRLTEAIAHFPVTRSRVQYWLTEVLLRSHFTDWETVAQLGRSPRVSKSQGRTKWEVSLHSNHLPGALQMISTGLEEPWLPPAAHVVRACPCPLEAQASLSLDSSLLAPTTWTHSRCSHAPGRAVGQRTRR